MPSTSFTSPTSAVNDASGGTTAWSITSVTNCVCLVDKTTSNYLEMTGYGLSIPAASAISGIEVTVTCSASGGGGGIGAPTLYAQLLKSGNVVGNAKSLFPLGTTTFGDASDKWSTIWSEAEVEASDFGVSIWVVGASNGTTVTVTGVTISVHYASGGPSGPPGSSTSGHFLFSYV